MNGLREYAISVIMMAMLCSLVLNLLQSSAAKGIVKMVCGMILTITAVAPLCRMDLSIQENLSSSFLAEAKAAASEGEDLNRDALRAVIKQELETYIQDKAADLNAEITAQVTLNNGDPPLPSWVVIKGDISPYAKQQLQKILQAQLGIAKESLEWTG